MYSRMEKYHGRRAQRFSIRKYSFGAASVLLGTALVLGANGVQAEETVAVNPATSELSNSDKNLFHLVQGLYYLGRHRLFERFYEV